MKLKKKSIVENDLILILVENRPTFFARVEKIYPDIKPGWWRVKLLILQIPVVVATWILDDEQIRGAEFTMQGTPVRIEKVEVPQETNEDIPEKQTLEPTQSTNRQARILSLNPESKK